MKAVSHPVVALHGFYFDPQGNLDDEYPFTFIDNQSRVVFFSRDKKDSEIWMGRVKLGLQ